MYVFIFSEMDYLLFFGEMTLNNYGSLWEIHHCNPISRTNLSNKTDMTIVTNWVNLRPLYKNENISTGSKVNYHFHLLQQIKANFFSKLDDQEGHSENFCQLCL